MERPPSPGWAWYPVPGDWWWKGHALGYAEATGDLELAEQHPAEFGAALPVEDVEDWWSGYSSGWETAIGRDRWGKES